MQIHASCAAWPVTRSETPDRDGTISSGVLLLGPAGSGKSDLLLRLIDRGFHLVADDRVDIENGIARAPTPLAGLVEVRGLGILRFPYLAETPLRLAVRLDASHSAGTNERLPTPARDTAFDLPVVRINPFTASAAQRVALALACLDGRMTQMVGAFAA